MSVESGKFNVKHVIGMSTLSVENSNQQLRKELSQIIQKPLEEQDSHIQALKSVYNHAISLESDPWNPPRYNCVQYAFDLVDPPEKIRTIARITGKSHRGQGIYPSPDFVQFLINEHILCELERAEIGSVVIYLDEGEVKHTGKVQGELIISKWSEGHLWRHRDYEVPIEYGNKVRFFKSISEQESVQNFSSYAKAKLGNRRYKVFE